MVDDANYRLKKEIGVGMKESELAWREFFGGKINPKNDEEEKQQLEEFCNWYNNVRKQSDTGKTPAEMYREIYGEDPLPMGETEGMKPSRVMSFGWNEDDDEEGDDEFESEFLVDQRKYFDEKIWPIVKKDVKEMTKKEACFSCFIMGSEVMAKSIEENIEEFSEELKGKTGEEIERILKEEDE